MPTLERSNLDLPWRWLASWSAVVVIALLISAAAGFRDIEAGALAVGGLFGLYELRHGTFGLVILGLLFADVAAWMAPGAVSNLAHGEPWIATALPSGLALASITGFVGVVATLVARRLHRPAGRTPLAIGIAALVLFAAANIAGAVGESDTGSPVQPGDLFVTAQHVRFKPAALKAKAGRIAITVGNLDLFWHTLTISDLHVSVRVPVQGERRLTFSAAKGTYEFVCAIPGHAQAGMTGTLTVS